MNITKLGHCCLLIEEKGLRILTDPGAYSTGQNEIKNIDSKKLEDYLKKIKEYSKKLGISLAETITLVVEYVSKASDDFSKSDFIKKFSDIWLF